MELGGRQMTYEDFYDLTVYLNDSRKGCLTPKEIAINAYNYLCDMRYTKENCKFAQSTKFLLKELMVDVLEDPNNEDAAYYLHELKKEIEWK